MVDAASTKQAVHALGDMQYPYSISDTQPVLTTESSPSATA